MPGFFERERYLETSIAGFSRNEPEIFAVREAMELAVFAMIIEGAEDGQWAFASDTAGKLIVDEYRKRYELARLGYSAQQIQQAFAKDAADTEAGG